MFHQLQSIEEKYERLQQSLCDPDVTADVAGYAKLSREIKQLTPVVETYRAYKAAQTAAAEAKELLDGGGLDKDFREMVTEEWESAKARTEELTEQLKILLLPKDPNDERSVIVEIRAGAGGEEAALFAGVLYRMYTMYAETCGFRVDVVYANETELGGFKEISFMIEGEGAYSRFKFESGVHRVQRVPVTESQGRIQTSTVTVAVLPEAEDVDVQINDTDLQIDTFRSSGAGGQHINKTLSYFGICGLR